MLAPVARALRRAAAARPRRRLVEGDPLAREARRLPGAGLVGHRADAAAPRVAQGRGSRGSRASRAETRQELPGITADRTFQIVAGAVVLHQAMKAMDVDELEVSPWALREGVLLRYTRIMC